ncbi:MAG: hypothetical protein H0U65_14015 [Rubrobacter sp.]|jgi:hypothetical protein|nr:hypothetical protein [Rubrobacter sp.]
MRGVAPWAVGSVLAFLVTSAAFLLLANLGTDPSEVRLEQRQSAPKSNAPLELALDENQLASFEAAPEQNMSLGVRNGGGDGLSDVNLTVEVYSEDTAAPEGQRQRKTIQALDPGESAEVFFDLDLSPPEAADEYPGPEQPRNIVEIRATTPGGTSAIRTVIFQPG